MHYHLFQYNDNKNDINVTLTRELTSVDFLSYYEYFTELNPNSDPSDWLKDYFDKMRLKGFCFGTFKSNKLVSLAETPDMPFMEDKIQRIGISTLEDFREQGYAKNAVLACIKQLLNNKICPQWECDANNIGSHNLALSVGFEKVADAMILF